MCRDSIVVGRRQRIEQMVLMRTMRWPRDDAAISARRVWDVLFGPGRGGCVATDDPETLEVDPQHTPLVRQRTQAKRLAVARKSLSPIIFSEFDRPVHLSACAIARDRATGTNKLLFLTHPKFKARPDRMKTKGEHERRRQCAHARCRSSGGDSARHDRLIIGCGETTVDRMTSGAHDVADQVSSAATQAAKQLRVSWKKLQKMEKRLEKNARGYVRRASGRILGIALTAGYVVARLLSPREDR